MAVEVSRDLTVQVLEDVNVVKLTKRQQTLRAAIQKGEPKCLGVSQVMLGLLVMSYSIPLHLTEQTDVVMLGVPWWSGLMFITAGVLTTILEKHSTMKFLQVCLMVSVISVGLSVAAVIIYSVDLHKNKALTCETSMYEHCSDEYYSTRMSRGLKSTLLLFTLAQTVISAVICFLLFRLRPYYENYDYFNQEAEPTIAAPHDLK